MQAFIFLFIMYALGPFSRKQSYILSRALIRVLYPHISRFVTDSEVSTETICLVSIPPSYQFETVKVLFIATACVKCHSFQTHNGSCQIHMLLIAVITVIFLSSTLCTWCFVYHT